MDERLREMGGRFKGLASKVALAELEQIQVDGSAMLDRAFDQMEMFLVNGEAALTAAKAEQRRQGSA